MNKKFTLSAWVIAAMMTMAPVGANAQTYSSTASTQVFDLSKLGDQTLLEHFAQLIEHGKKYPTDADLTAWGIKDEVEFIRSHVRKRTIESRADRLLQDTYENRNLFMNIPGGAGTTDFSKHQVHGLMLLTAMVQASSQVLSSSIIQLVEQQTVGLTSS